MNISIYKKNECCGCTTCMNKCPTNAIIFNEDENGFLYPHIKPDKCIDCGLCIKVCDFNKEIGSNSTVKELYGLQHKSKEVLRRSSSGGAFSAISDIILKQQGIIYGSILDSTDFDVYHSTANNSEERNKMCGSKYVQSNLKNVFNDINKQLLNKKHVLFIGTPCQVAGLKSYLNDSNKEFLTTVDFLCHGVPSPLLLKEHKKYLEKHRRKKAIFYKFRDKKYGWSIHTETVTFENLLEKSSLKVNKMKQLFYSNLNLRPSCYNCKYASEHRYSDITIGDFWGAPKELKIYNNKGVSCVIINTEKGYKLLTQLNDTCKLRKADISSVKQNALKKHVSKPLESDEFWKLYHHKGYEAVLDKYARFSPRSIFSFYMHRIVHTIHLDSMVFRIISIIR